MFSFISLNIYLKSWKRKKSSLSSREQALTEIFYQFEGALCY